MPSFYRRPKTKRGALLAIGGSLLGVAGGAFALVYFLLLPTSSPKPFALSTQTTGSSQTVNTSPKVSTSSTASAPAASARELVGRWTIAAGSRAGYRVREKLGFLPAQSDAVGRTSAIQGQMTFTSSKRTLTLKAASFTADVSTLKSDESRRDDRIHTIGLESDLYPTAAFVLSSPLKLPATALPGRVIHVSVTGIVKIHGTSKRETIPVEMRLTKSAIEAVGSLIFRWNEFSMTAPSVAGFVNVADKATMEFDLRLQHG